MFKVNNRNTRTRCETCSKLIIKTPEQVSLLLTLNMFHTLLSDWDSNKTIMNQPNVFKKYKHWIILSHLLHTCIEKLETYHSLVRKALLFFSGQQCLWELGSGFDGT